MAVYSVAEAKAKLSALIDEALEGESVVITRHGQPVVEIKGVTEKRQPRRITQADIEWLKQRRVGKKMPAEDAGALLSGMRDEGWK